MKIYGVDCYGTLDGSNNVEVIPNNSESFIVDASGFTSWSKLVKHLHEQFADMAELIAD